MDETLYVFWGDVSIGQLTEKTGELQFQYNTSWLTSKNAAPISAQLPLQEIPFSDMSSRCFFANLLPEGNVRTMIARRLGVSEDNDFALLKSLGGDCAGALSLWPNAQPATRPLRYDPLSAEQLDGMIDDMAASPLMTSGEDLRLSLAGAQQKIPLLLDGDRFFTPHGVAASSHIVKPDISVFPGSSINEGFCMSLARHIGLPVPQTRLWRGRHTALIIERYDRQHAEGEPWTRLHQEDFCQALGYPHGRKYEMDGGPGLTQAFDLLGTQSAQPIPDKTILLRGTVFNVCIGNMDAHAKNFSMLIDANSYHLAPLYDLISTRIYGSLSPKLAMRIGGQIRPEWLTRAHWETLAQEAAIAPKTVVQTVEEIAGLLPEECLKLRASYEARGDETLVLEKLIRYITTASQGVLAQMRKPSV